jgi:hypothetical protein
MQEDPVSSFLTTLIPLSSGSELMRGRKRAAIRILYDCEPDDMASNSYCRQDKATKARGGQNIRVSVRQMKTESNLSSSRCEPLT